MVELLEENSSHLTSKVARTAKKFLVPATLRHDLQSLLAIVKTTFTVPLPIMGPEPLPGPTTVSVFTDVSGHLLANPSLGIYVPKQLHYEHPLVASLALPHSFLNKCDSSSNKAHCKTTALESLGFLSVLCLDPLRFAEKEAVFHMDNIATVLTLSRGYSADSWASTLVRAARVVAAGIGCCLFAEWERRSSSRAGRVADDLTHNLVRDLTREELEAFLSLNQVSFPPPILAWMANPSPQQGLGRKCLLWVNQQFPAIQINCGQRSK